MQKNDQNNGIIGGKKKIQQVLLSNDTIRQRIDDMAANVCQQVSQKSSKAMDI